MEEQVKEKHAQKNSIADWLGTVAVVAFFIGLIATVANMLYDNDRWGEIGALGRNHGFEWGGDWTPIADKPHFQMTFGFTTAQLRDRIS